MKILWITEFFPKSKAGEITGGVEARCFFVSRYLRQLSHQVEVVAERTSGDQWAHLSFSTLPKGIAFFVSIAFKSLKYLFSDFDIVEGTNYTTYPLAWILAKIKNKPVVFWYPDVFSGSWVKNIGPAGIIGEITEWIVLHLPVDKYIAISQTTAAKLIRFGINPDKIVVISCGVDQDLIAQVKIPQRKKFDVCVVSRLMAYKKIADLIKVATPELAIVIIGQGPEKARLIRLSTGKNITFLGHLSSYQAVMKTIADSRIFCHPSAVEGFGIAIIEAAALGVPYLARNIPVISEITHGGKGGLLFENGDLGPKLSQLLLDRKLYQKKSKEAKVLARNYSWETVAQQTAGIYENLSTH